MFNCYCTDLEGVLVPEIWINVAQSTGIEDLKLTTRDIADYDELMQRRLKILDQHGLKLADLQAVIARIAPLEGAREYLDWIRQQMPVTILSDTFEQFAGPLMAQLGYPNLICHKLEIAPDGRISSYRLRQQNGKKRAVKAFQGLGYRVLAVGDSYNDVEMLQQAENGILFCPPDNVVAAFNMLPVTRTYAELKEQIRRLTDSVQRSD